MDARGSAPVDFTGPLPLSKTGRESRRFVRASLVGPLPMAVVAVAAVVVAAAVGAGAVLAAPWQDPPDGLTPSEREARVIARVKAFESTVKAGAASEANWQVSGR